MRLLIFIGVPAIFIFVLYVIRHYKVTQMYEQICRVVYDNIKNDIMIGVNFRWRQNALDSFPLRAAVFHFWKKKEFFITEELKQAMDKKAMDKYEIR